MKRIQDVIQRRKTKKHKMKSKWFKRMEAQNGIV